MTSQEYNRNLDVIRQLYPDSEWLPLLNRGYNAANVLYIEEAMNELKLNVRNIVENVEVVTLNDETSTIKTDTDEHLYNLYIKLNKLQGNRSKLSNKFHTCISDKQRHNISKYIAEVQVLIGSTMKSIDYYKATGIKVEELEDDFDLPNDKFALSKKLNVIRAMVSKIKKRIREIEEGPEVNKKLLDQERNTLKKYLIAKLYAEQKIDSL